MKLNLTLLTGTLILLVFGSAGAQTAPPAWTRYTVPEGQFSVELPTVPSMTTTSSFREEVKKTRWEITLGVYAEGLIYECDVYENVEQQSLKDFIREKTANWEIDSATPQTLSVNGVAGKEYLFKNSMVLATSWFFATDKRVWRFGVGGATKDDPRVKRFFSSIVLGPKQDGVEVSDGPGVPFHQNEVGEKAYVGRDVDKKVRIAIKPEPAYTEEARQSGTMGTVVLKVIFTSAGNVSNIWTVSGLPYGLTERAIAAARKIKFYPAIKDGKNVSMWIQLEYNFNLY